MMNAGFVFDDRFLIVESFGHLDLSNIWLSDLWGSDHGHSGFYRPLFLSSIYLDQYLWGLNPLGYHLHNWIWVWLCIIAFGLLIREKYNQQSAMLMMIFFGLHPFLSEGVYWISARNDTMSAFWLLMAWRYWEKAQQQYSHLLGICFLLALLSKETAVVWMVLVFWNDCQKRRWQTSLYLGLILGLLIVWRGILGIVPNMIAWNDLDWNLVIGQLPTLMMDNWGRLLWSWRLSPATPAFSLILSNFQMGLGLFMMVAQLWLLRSEPQRFKYFLAMILGLILAVPQILHTGLYGDRYWIIPLIFYFMAIHQTVLLRAQVLLLPFWLVLIVYRGGDWESDHHFWNREVEQNRTSFSLVSLGNILYNEENYAEAMRTYYDGYNLKPSYFYSCDIFVASVLKVEGPQSAIQAAHWILNQGCPVSGEILGLMSVSYAANEQWEEAFEIAQTDLLDATKRIDVVRVIEFYTQEDWLNICRILQSWSHPIQLLTQIEILTKDKLVINFYHIQIDRIAEQCGMSWEN